MATKYNGNMKITFLALLIVIVVFFVPTAAHATVSGQTSLSQKNTLIANIFLFLIYVIGIYFIFKKFMLRKVKKTKSLVIQSVSIKVGMTIFLVILLPSLSISPIFLMAFLILAYLFIDTAIIFYNKEAGFSISLLGALSINMYTTSLIVAGFILDSYLYEGWYMK